jgi:hypothetical protein
LPGAYLAKSRRITDGELLHLLTQHPSTKITDFDNTLYGSLQNVKSETRKSLIWVVGFAALGVLAHFNFVKEASAAGLELAPTVFAHVALVGGSMSGAWFCFTYTKQSFLQAWFGWKLKAGTPAFKAECLLRFPEAYFHISYLPGSIGYPPFYLARQSMWPQLVYVLLFLIAVVVGGVGSIALWIMLASDVLANSQINHTVSTLTVVFCAAITLLGWTSPFRYDLPRRYTHTGLVALLTKRTGQRSTEAYRRILRAAARMGLIKIES